MKVKNKQDHRELPGGISVITSDGVSAIDDKKNVTNKKSITRKRLTQ